MLYDDLCILFWKRCPNLRIPMKLREAVICLHCQRNPPFSDPFWMRSARDGSAPPSVAAALSATQMCMFWSWKRPNI